MKKVFALLLFIFSLGSLTHLVCAQQPPRPFKISFEMNGKPVETNLTVRIKQAGNVTEIKYSPAEPIAFPELQTGERFDLWIITDNYIFPFLDMHPDALKVAGWRLGVDVRPFHLDYGELKMMRRNIKLVYYIIYQRDDGGETPIWFESRQSLRSFRK